METFDFLGFGVDAWITIITILAMFTVLLFTKLRSDVVFLVAVGILYVTGVLDAKEALSGISSTSVAVVGVLFVVIAGLMHTGVLQWIVKHLLGTPNTYTKAVMRLMLPVAALSSFLSNTTVVALFVNIVKMWSKKLGISPSKLLIPLSYASGMGGVCTLIGTPPNLIISGLYEEKTGEAMNILATTIPGLFCLAVGVLSIIAMRRLLPNRKTPEEAFASTGDYTVEMLVPSDNQHIGMTIGELKLNTVRGGSLVELRHFDGEKVLSPVPDDEPLMGGDRLVYAGQIGELLELEQTHGLVNADHHVFHYDDVNKEKHYLRTAYITFGSSLIGTTMGTNGFEKEHKLILVAVSRRGSRIEESPRSVVLKAGDTLLLESASEQKTDSQRMASDLHFFESEEIPNIDYRTLISTVIMLAIAEKLGYEPFPFLIALMIAVSSSFATPIGSPTHMLVYGPGGYRFSDFLRIGLLMNLIILAANIFIVNWVYPLTPLNP